ncbi:hypothetical protein FB45DRAFT_931699 [Roridomyces roridus]|uniref:Uncharacterized protein n=1 Tax=Roridomyces roridus TaxID=1738132 RepID=A0AAD7BDW0_9AGAR|nr:hypothetical protein FB45DRAFT_931699 [Roridomyces roridus]
MSAKLTQSRTLRLTEDKGFNYTEHRDSVPPPESLVGSIGDIYLDTKAPALYARYTDGWKQWQGPQSRLEHPLQPGCVLWPSPSNGRVSWVEKSKMKKLLGSAKDILGQIVSTLRKRDSKKPRKMPGSADVQTTGVVVTAGSSELAPATQTDAPVQSTIEKSAPKPSAPAPAPAKSSGLTQSVPGQNKAPAINPSSVSTAPSTAPSAQTEAAEPPRDSSSRPPTISAQTTTPHVRRPVAMKRPPASRPRPSGVSAAPSTQTKPSELSKVSSSRPTTSASSQVAGKLKKTPAPKPTATVSSRLSGAPIAPAQTVVGPPKVSSSRPRPPITNPTPTEMRAKASGSAVEVSVSSGPVPITSQASRKPKPKEMQGPRPAPAPLDMSISSGPAPVVSQALAPPASQPSTKPTPNVRPASPEMSISSGPTPVATGPIMTSSSQSSSAPPQPTKSAESPHAPASTSVPLVSAPVKAASRPTESASAPVVPAKRTAPSPVDDLRAQKRSRKDYTYQNAEAAMAPVAQYLSGHTQAGIAEHALLAVGRHIETLAVQNARAGETDRTSSLWRYVSFKLPETGEEREAKGSALQEIYRNIVASRQQGSGATTERMDITQATPLPSSSPPAHSRQTTPLSSTPPPNALKEPRQASALLAQPGSAPLSLPLQPPNATGEVPQRTDVPAPPAVSLFPPTTLPSVSATSVPSASPEAFSGLVSRLLTGTATLMRLHPNSASVTGSGRPHSPSPPSPGPLASVSVPDSNRIHELRLQYDQCQRANERRPDMDDEWRKQSRVSAELIKALTQETAVLKAEMALLRAARHVTKDEGTQTASDSKDEDMPIPDPTEESMVLQLQTGGDDVEMPMEGTVDLTNQSLAVSVPAIPLVKETTVVSYPIPIREKTPIVESPQLPAAQAQIKQESISERLPSAPVRNKGSVDVLPPKGVEVIDLTLDDSDDEDAGVPASVPRSSVTLSPATSAVVVEASEERVGSELDVDSGMEVDDGAPPPAFEELMDVDMGLNGTCVNDVVSTVPDHFRIAGREYANSDLTRIVGQHRAETDQSDVTWRAISAHLQVLSRGPSSADSFSVDQLEAMAQALRRYYNLHLRVQRPVDYEPSEPPVPPTEELLLQEEVPGEDSVNEPVSEEVVVCQDDESAPVNLEEVLVDPNSVSEPVSEEVPVVCQVDESAPAHVDELPLVVPSLVDPSECKRMASGPKVKVEEDVGVLPRLNRKLLGLVFQITDGTPECTMCITINAPNPFKRSGSLDVLSSHVMEAHHDAATSMLEATAGMNDAQIQAWWMED